MSALLKLSIVLTFVATLSCSVNKQHVSNDYIKSNEVAFVEFYQTQDGEVISGTAPQGRRIDGPTYRFNKSTRQIEILRKTNFSLDSVMAILGNGKILKGAAGNGLSMRLNGISKFPFAMNGLTILNINDEGIHLIFNKEKLLVKEGQQWQTTTTTIDTIKIESPVIMRLKTTYTINYVGKINKSSVVEK